MTLDNRQYSELQKNMGEKAYEAAEKFLTSERYSNLSDDFKGSVLQELYNKTYTAAKNELFGSPYDDKDVDAYINEGADSLIDRIIAKKQLNSAGLSANDKNMQMALSGGEQAVQEYAEKSQMLKEAGLSVSEKNMKLADQGAGAVQAYAEEKDMYKKYGLESSDQAKSIYAERQDENLLKEFSKLNGKSKQADMIPVLESTSLSDEDRGYLLSKKLSSFTKQAQQFLDNGNYEDLYLYYTIKNDIDTDHNGTLKKSEKSLLDAYLKQQGYSQADIQEIKGWY